MAKDPSAPRPPEEIVSDLERAIQLSQAGQLDDAAELCDAVLAEQPDFAVAQYVGGIVALQQDRRDDAEALIEKAIAGQPNNAEWINMLGVVRERQGKLEDAAATFEAALAADPGDSAVQTNLGRVWQRLGRLDEAIATLERVVETEPESAEALFHLGIALYRRGKVAEATPHLERAAEAAPGVETLNSLGAVLADQGRLGDAMAAFRASLELQPDLNEACAGLYPLLQVGCEWNELDELGTKLDALNRDRLAQGMPAAEPPLGNVGRVDDPASNLEIARSWGQAIAVEAARHGVEFPAAGRRRDTGGKIRLGYLSRDFQDHPLVHLMGRVFPLHDRDRFIVTAYSLGPDDGSRYREQIAQDSDRFVDMEAMDNLEAAERIHADGIDILVDLMGHTRRNRLEICALRPAPVQVTYLGFPGTAGAAFLDYAIGDKTVTPVENDNYYREKLVILPHCYQMNDNNSQISDKPITRADFGLPEDAFVFCSFNNPSKIDPVMFDIWMDLLRDVPNSVLWLFHNNELARRNLEREAAVRDIAADRLVFADMIAKEEHLARMRLADLALDTRIYNGHTTTSDALWAGLPVVTLEGRHFASRVSSSILQAMNMPDLITHDLAAYKTLTANLAGDRSALQAVRQRIEQNRATAPLFDTPAFVGQLEAAYERMWGIHLSGESPQPIIVGAGD